MSKTIAKTIDKLVPRHEKIPKNIHVSLETFLSRLANFNRKFHGTKYRLTQWNSLCAEHKLEFEKSITAAKKFKLNKKTRATRFNLSLTDSRIENEFEALLYSFSSTLTALTRLIACFMKGSTDFKSHSKLSSTLKSHANLSRIQLVVDKARDFWANELKNRRDAATHYIALSIQSTFINTKSNSSRSKKNVIHIGITKTSTKSVSIWEDIIPTIGGTVHQSVIREENGHTKETHELLDNEKRLILHSEHPIPPKPELIDGEKYVRLLHRNLNSYISKVLMELKYYSNRS